MKLSKLVLSLGVLLSLSLTGELPILRNASAGIGDELGLSPYWDWQQIKTEHFRIVFPKELAPRAERVAQLYEEAHRDMKGDLRWEPWWRVNVLLVDNSDAANGLTTPISRFGMLLYLTSPDTFSGIDQYDDWLKLLIYHEYTHFLNMDATRDFYVPLRYAFGDVLLPNSAWPAWMLEGYAVYNETKFTHAGRGRSPYWAGILRSAVESGGLNRSDFVQLNELSPSYPWFPSGESVYLFGYHLMNQVERTKKTSLSEMSERSSSRIPYFINGNLENIIGKDWYRIWDEWVAETTPKMKAQLATLSSQPLSKVERLDGTNDESFGVAFSPDSNWVAYSTQSADRWQELKVRGWNEPAEKARAVDDKFSGAGIAFTSDSKQVVYSSLHRLKNYYYYSDLRAYNLATGANYWLTDGLRARDPDLSKDGNWVVYTETNEAGTDLVLGKLSMAGDRLRVESHRKIVDAGPYERIANPKFTGDSKGIVFSWKRNGKKGDDLYYYPLKTSKAVPLVADGFSNRFPAVDGKGSLYFISDKTGVDNLYRYSGSLDAGAPAASASRSVLVTNLTGGLWLPAFRDQDLYGSSLSKEGFSISKVSTFASVDAAKATIKIAEDAPTRDSSEIKASASSAVPANYSIEKYSALPTLLPRQWAPLWLSDENSTLLGGQVFGYDNTFRHQYFAYGGHNSTPKTLDYSVQYENRSFGPTLQLYAQKLTSDIVAAENALSGNTNFTRETEVGANLSFPFQGTISRLTPSIGLRVERDYFYDIPASTGTKRELAKTRLVPEQDVQIEHRNTRSSRLSVAPERGGISLLGVRRYDLERSDVFKGIAKHTQYFNLGKHWVLSPSVKAMKVSRKDFSFLDSTAISRGKRNRVLDPLYSDSFDEFGIRGYPSETIFSREAITTAMDLRFPLSQIFRGWGTNPLFFERLWMQAFAEDTYRPSAAPRFQHLASVGAGLRLDTELLIALPLSFEVDYHYGFNKNAGGQGELFFSIGASSVLPF